MSPQDLSKIRCKKPLKTISSPIGAMITTVKKTNRSEKTFSGERSESRFKKASGNGKIESMIIFNSLDIITIPKESINEKIKVFFEIGLILKLSVSL